MSRLLVEALAVAAKDLRTEFRTRVALNALGLFALTVLALSLIHISEPTRPTT